MGRFREKTVIVTRTGSGIGKTTALQFAREGAQAVLVDLWNTGVTVQEI